MLTLNPQTRKKLARFRKIRLGYFSFLILGAMIALLSVAELFVNSRALIVHYNDTLYFPTYGSFYPGTTFGEDYSYEVNYRALAKSFETNGSDNWVLMPLVPYDPYENDAKDGIMRPEAPDFSVGHYLGTDTTSRDILARLVYGTRTALLFAFAFMCSVYLIGIVIGCAMGYLGGLFDLFFQRLIEIWSNIPFLYMEFTCSYRIITPFLLSSRGTLQKLRVAGKSVVRICQIPIEARGFTGRSCQGKPFEFQAFAREIAFFKQISL